MSCEWKWSPKLAAVQLSNTQFRGELLKYYLLALYDLRDQRFESLRCNLLALDLLRSWRFELLKCYLLAPKSLAIRIAIS